VVTLERVGVHMPDPLHLEGWEEIDEPLATDPHNNEQIDVYTALRARFAGPSCYVSLNRWLRMDPANPRDLLLPDILVALGVADRSDESHYVPSDEGKAPDLLIEFLSQDSLKADRSVKPRRYGKLGVRELFVFNPAGLFSPHHVRIQGWSLDTTGGRTSLPVEPDGGVNSRVLPVRFAIRFNQLFVLDQVTGVPITELQEMRLAYMHEAEARQREAEARQREAEARAQAEAEVRRLRELLERRLS
jgi:Uma2 family endonuclease